MEEELSFLACKATVFGVPPPDDQLWAFYIPTHIYTIIPLF